jgi:hypothetical protein
MVIQRAHTVKLEFRYWLSEHGMLPDPSHSVILILWYDRGIDDQWRRYVNAILGPGS